MRKRILNKHGGFTLVELLTVIAVVMILTLIAVPNFITWRGNYRFRSAIQDMIANFQLAKMTAIRNVTMTTITFKQPIGGITYDYVVFVDTDRDLKYKAGERIIKRVNFSEYVNVELDPTKNPNPNFKLNSDNLIAVSFRQNGLPCTEKDKQMLSADSNIYLKNTTSKLVKAINISPAGNITVQ